MSRWRIGLGLLLAAAYAVLCHLLLLHAAGQPWTVAVLLGPWLAIGFAWAWRRRHSLAIVAMLLAILGVGMLALRGGVGDVTRLYLLQHAGIHAALFVSFALTLRPDHVSLITRVAQHVHGTLAPGMAAYTRRVTAAWALYFITMATTSVVVYAAWPWSTWSLLANVVTPIAIAALFVGEHLLRYRIHPEFERASLVDAIRGYRHRDPVPGDIPSRTQGGRPWRRT